MLIVQIKQTGNGRISAQTLEVCRIISSCLRTAARLGSLRLRDRTTISDRNFRTRMALPRMDFDGVGPASC